MSLVSKESCYSFFWPHHVACGILVPQPGIEPGSLAVKAWSPNHWITENSLKSSDILSALMVHCWRTAHSLQRTKYIFGRANIYVLIFNVLFIVVEKAQILQSCRH